MLGQVKALCDGDYPPVRKLNEVKHIAGSAMKLHGEKSASFATFQVAFEPPDTLFPKPRKWWRFLKFLII